jgi:23S rRNA (pseudouridine1915-N3)-methyltransferase
MKLYVVAISHKMPHWVNEAIQDYCKRMPKDATVIVKELKPDINPSKEAIKLLETIPKNSYIIALDERGKDLTTNQMADHFAKWQQLGKDIYFVIGGADGLDPSIKNMSQDLWRLSSLTLPHAVARLVLIEQLYRSWTILQNHPYHRE